MILGIIAGLLTCALWGLTFVAPRAIAPFTVWDLTVARYCIFGLLCALLMTLRRFRPHGLPTATAITGLLLGGAGYVGYFIMVGFAVHFAGASVPPVIIGTMPVFLAIIGNFYAHSVPWRVLVLPLGSIIAGVIIVNLSAFTHGGDIMLGVIASVAALGIWIIYGLVNAAVMRGKNAPDALQWTGLQGIGAAIGSLPLITFTTFWSPEIATTPELYRFLAWAIVMGTAGSWLATLCWVTASRRLPLALAAQLIVAETLFALLYGFLFENRWPMFAEGLGAGLQMCLLVDSALFKTLSGNQS